MEQLSAACAALDVPQIYAGSGDAIDTDRLARLAAEAWVHTLLPQSLGGLQTALDEVRAMLPTLAPESRDAMRTALQQAVVATGRLVPPSGISLDPADDGPPLPPPHVEDDPLWYVGSAACVRQASELRQAALCLLSDSSDDSTSDAAAEAVSVAETLLTTYVKPLFSAPNKGVNAAGRERRMPVGIVDVRGDPSLHDMRLAEEMVWKGGAPCTDRVATSAASHTWARAETLAPAHVAPDVRALVGRRHAGIGAIHVVAWCACVLGPALDQARSASAEQPALWWSLVLPPLISLLEDADLRVRLVAVRAAFRFLLAPGMRRWAAAGERGAATAHAVALLQRSGLARLVETQLDTNTSLLGHRLTPALVWDSVCAGRALALLTTLRAPARAPGAAGAAAAVLRFDRLCRLISHAVLRPLAFIAVPHAPFALPRRGARAGEGEGEGKQEPAASAWADGAEAPMSDARQTQHHSVATLRTLFRAAPVLLADVGPGGAGRLFDVLAEALLGVLEGVRPVVDGSGRAQAAGAGEHERVRLDRGPQTRYAQTASAAAHTLSVLVRLVAQGGGPGPLAARGEELVAGAAGAWVGFELYEEASAGAACGDAGAGHARAELARRVQELVRDVAARVPATKEVSFGWPAPAAGRHAGRRRLHARHAARGTLRGHWGASGAGRPVRGRSHRTARARRQRLTGRVCSAQMVQALAALDAGRVAGVAALALDPEHAAGAEREPPAAAAAGLRGGTADS